MSPSGTMVSMLGMGGGRPIPFPPCCCCGGGGPAMLAKLTPPPGPDENDVCGDA